MSSTYLNRYAVQQAYIKPRDYQNPGIVVVIPCHKEKYLIDSLESLEKCENPTGQVAIIVVINAAENDEAAIHLLNENTLKETQYWLDKESKKYQYHFILENQLPKKHAGVGLARKIGMDEAVRMFEHNNRDGVILCFDADSLCDANLLVEVENLYIDQKVLGSSIHYEHPLLGDLPEANYAGIINYELHLRYYVDALKYAGFPYAYQTIGSSMAVRSSAYQKQGGMNRRKAGEDFYFLHRIIPLGNFKNLNTTKIIPSPRCSDRVPFGTGKAIGDWLDSDMNHWLTYNPRIFEALKLFFSGVDGFYECERFDASYKNLPTVVQSFLSEHEFVEKLEEIKIHSTTLINFQKRFFHWFDAFKILKLVHHARDNGFDNVRIDEAADWILSKYEQPLERRSKKEKLLLIRKLNREEISF